MAKLVIYQEFAGEETVFEDFNLVSPRLLIGSGLDNDLVLQQAAEVEAVHASMELRNEDWILQDLGSPGGTAVNGVEIDGPFRLHHGDLIELGSVKLRFEEVESLAGDVDAATEEEGEAEGVDLAPNQLRGRIWFAGIAGITLAIIFIIIFLLVVADYLDVLNVMDLLPPWFG